jgi:hypothetical protein
MCISTTTSSAFSHVVSMLHNCHRNRTCSVCPDKAVPCSYGLLLDTDNLAAAFFTCTNLRAFVIQLTAVYTARKACRIFHAVEPLLPILEQWFHSKHFTQKGFWVTEFMLTSAYWKSENGHGNTIVPIVPMAISPMVSAVIFNFVRFLGWNLFKQLVAGSWSFWQW